jgi:nucleoside-diphosphate-sugar epimerase
MKIAITGESGFLGQRFARELLRSGDVNDAGGNPQPIRELVLVDIATPANRLVDPKVRYPIGGVASPKFIAETFGDDNEGIFHLAAVVSGAAEADFDLGRRVNVDGTRGLLDACQSARLDTARADSLGFPRDESGFDRSIGDYVRDEGLKL